MRKFRKRSDLHVVVLPNVGRLRDQQVLTGDEFAKFVPHLLEEIPETAPPSAPAEPEPAPVASERETARELEPVVLVEPAPVPAEATALTEPAPAPIASGESVELLEGDLMEEEEGEEETEDFSEAPSEASSTASEPAPRKRGRPRKGSR